MHTKQAIASRDGITLEEFKTLLDVINVYDPDDIAHVYPEMGKPEFLQDVRNIFKKLLIIVKDHPDNQPNEISTMTQKELDAVTEASFGNP